MKKFEQEKLIEVVLYILNATKGLDFYHVFKILYFAERDHLKLWGDRITDDDFIRMTYGPVPTHLYGAVENKKSFEPDLSLKFENAIKFAGEDAPNVLLAQRHADMDYLSESDIECLDRAIKENSDLTFDELFNKSHDSAYLAASYLGIIKPADMARAAGANQTMIDFIEEQIQVDKALA